MLRELSARSAGIDGAFREAERRGHDYDAYYQALDLPPGASLQEIEDRVQLLDALFDAADLPTGLRQPAVDRAQLIKDAGEELRRFWQQHGKPPPSAISNQPPRAHHAPVQRIEIAVEVTHRHAPVPPPLLRPTSPTLIDAVRRSGSTFAANATTPIPFIAPSNQSPSRRRVPALLKVAALSIVAALAAWHFGIGRLVPDALGEAAPAAAALPVATQPGLMQAMAPPTGVFAQPPVRYRDANH